MSRPGEVHRPQDRPAPRILPMLDDMDMTGLAHGGTLIWDDTAKKWKPHAQHRIPFSYAGALALSTSTPWTPVATCTLTAVLVLLGTAGTSSTVVTVYVNGSSVGTVTLGSGVTSNSVSLSSALTASTDLVTIGITTVGTGAKDLTALAQVA